MHISRCNEKTDENLRTIIDDELYELSQIQVKRVNEKKGRLVS